MRLLLVRHGIAEGQEGRVVGHTDSPISDRGRAEIAGLLSPGLQQPDLVLSSDLRRARASAQILAAQWGMEVVTDPRLRELHFGEWEGRTWKELEQVDEVRLDQWMRDWTRAATPGGESFPDLAARVSHWLAECRKSGKAVGTIVVVAHAGSIRAILCLLLEVPFERAFEFEVDYARVTAVELRGTPRLVCRNAASWPHAWTEEGTKAR